VPFTAHLIDAATGPPAITAVSTTTNLNVDGPPTFTTCNVQSAGSLLGFLLGLNNAQVSQVDNFTGAGTNMNTGTKITVTYTPQSGTANSFIFLPSTNSTAWTLSGTSSVTYAIGIAKNGITPVPKNAVGLNVLGVLLGGYGNSFSYTATRNDGKTATCGPVAVTVFS
jgi:hypothetical protein